MQSCCRCIRCREAGRGRALARLCARLLLGTALTAHSALAQTPPPAAEAPALPAPEPAPPAAPAPEPTPPAAPAPAQPPPAAAAGQAPQLVPPRVLHSVPPIYPAPHQAHGEH